MANPAPRRRTQRTTRTTNRTAARTAGAGSISASAVAAEEARSNRMADWAIEMKHINHDLRELLVISVILFVLLFAVGFFL